MLTRNEKKYLTNRIQFHSVFLFFFHWSFLIITLPIVYFSVDFPFDKVNVWNISFLIIFILFCLHFYKVIRTKKINPSNFIEEEGFLIINPNEKGSYYLWNHKHISIPGQWENESLKPILNKSTIMRGYELNHRIFWLKTSIIFILSVDHLSINEEMNNGYFIKKPIFYLFHIPILILLLNFGIMLGEMQGEVRNIDSYLSDAVSINNPQVVESISFNQDQILKEYNSILYTLTLLGIIEVILIFFTCLSWIRNDRIASEIKEKVYSLSSNT